MGIYEGLGILELGVGAAAPVATRYFAEQGARVIRVESAQRPDFLRALFARPDDPDGLECSPMFAALNPDKESVTLNLAKPEAVEIVKRLVMWADVVSENFSPGVMDKWGLGSEALERLNPRAILVSGSLFGKTGPQRHYPGFGGQGAAIAGFNHLTGWPDREPHGPYGTITDSLAPRYVAVAIAAALLERERTGRGKCIDLSQIEAGVYSLSELIVRCSANAESAARQGNRHERAAPHAIYPCQGEDRWIAIAIWNETQWQAFLAVMGDPDWAREARFASAGERLAHRAELDTRIETFTRDQEAIALMEALQAAGVEAGVVQNVDDLRADPQLAHRGHFESLEHPVLGELPCEHSGFRLSESPGRLDRPGPKLGEHNQQVLGELLGLPAQEIERLVHEEVIA